MIGQVWFHLMEGRQLNDDSLNSLIMCSYLVASMLEPGQSFQFYFQLAPLLIEVSHYPKTLCNAISLAFLLSFRKTIIIWIMHYVYKRHLETNRENIKVGI